MEISRESSEQEQLNAALDYCAAAERKLGAINLLLEKSEITAQSLADRLIHGHEINIDFVDTRVQFLTALIRKETDDEKRWVIGEDLPPLYSLRKYYSEEITEIKELLETIED